MSNLKTKYTTIDSIADDKLSAIRLDDGPFEGVVYHYESIRFVEPVGEETNATVKIDYNIEVTPDHLVWEEVESQITAIVGDIALELMCHVLEAPESDG